eukprot:SAG25_NODE_2947_length_1303_cov_1.511628_1_plen_48_part_10
MSAAFWDSAESADAFWESAESADAFWESAFLADPAPSVTGAAAARLLR